MGTPIAECLTLTERVLKAGNDWLEAEDDTDYEAAKRRFLSLSKELACSTCPVASRRRARFEVRRPPPPDLPLFTWAKVPLP